jgi:conjugative transfer region protein TrbK
MGMGMNPLSMLAAVTLAVLLVAACTIRLRGDQEAANLSSDAGAPADRLATKLGECRPASYEQKDTLTACRMTWLQKRSRLVGQNDLRGAAEPRAAREEASPVVQPKSESRLPSVFPQSSHPE